ncbi:hypothetical protein HYS54_03535 [Candidatus Micrarchaeota archaeon]|nr:hypothetical protein [Candidatus Micrarchaeota archaeon]
MKRALFFVVLCQFVLAAVALGITITPEMAEDMGCTLANGKTSCPQPANIDDVQATFTDDLFCISNDGNQDLSEFVCAGFVKLHSPLNVNVSYQVTDIATEDFVLEYRTHQLKAEEYDVVVYGGAVDKSKCSFSGSNASCAYNNTQVRFGASYLPETTAGPETIIIKEISIAGAGAPTVDNNLIYLVIGLLIVIVAIAALRKKQRQ